MNPNNLTGWAVRLAVAVGAAALWAFATSSMPGWGWVAYGGVGLVALWVVLQAGDWAFRARRARNNQAAPAEEAQEPAHAAP